MPGRRIPAPLSLVLTTLRTSKGWSQKELGEAAGLPHGFVSDYEVGRRPLTRPKLEELAAILGYPSESIDILLFSIRFLRKPDPPPGRPLSPTRAELEQIEWSLARAVRLAADVGREDLVRGFREKGIRKDRARAEALWEILKPQTSVDRRSMVEGSRELRSWALCERVCAESAKAAAADANRALDLADLALHIANHARGPEGWRSRLQGYAWAFVGNARRVASDLPGADKAFGKAWELWKACPLEEQGPLPEWRLLDLEASLRRDQRRLPEALDLIDRALAGHTGEAPSRIFLKKAFTLEQMGDHERAIETLQQASSQVDGETEPRLLFALRFNLAVNLSQLGRHAEAAGLLPEIRVLALRLEKGPDQIRTFWLEGRIAAGLGRRDEAVSFMTRVRTEFANRGLSYDVALSTLELAVLYLEEGQMAKVKELARQMTSIFRAQGVHREAIAALKVFRDAAEREAATAELARRVVDYLCRARHDPGLKFQG
jgi:transcriptional regulator with XRE-family HTH domain